MTSPSPSTAIQNSDLSVADVDEAVLRDVERTIETLLDMELDLERPADLERVRQALPTDSRRAQILHFMLPRPLREALEYVEENDRQAAYWRRSRERADPEALSPAELRQRIAFIEAASETQGRDGVVPTRDGRFVSSSAIDLGEQLRGAEFRDPDELTATEQRRGRELLSRIKDTLRL